MRNSFAIESFMVTLCLIDHAGIKGAENCVLVKTAEESFEIATTKEDVSIFAVMKKFCNQLWGFVQLKCLSSNFCKSAKICNFFVLKFNRKK